MMRQILLYTDEDGTWIADVPSLPGCHSDGATVEEALTNVREAIAEYVAALVESGNSVPGDKLNAMIVVLEAAYG